MQRLLLIFLLAFLAVNACAEEHVREFLDGLRARSYHDVAMYYLDQMQASRLAPPEMKATILYEKSLLLIDSSRKQRDPAVRLRQLNQSQQWLQQFIQTQPESPKVNAARSQLGSLIVERARMTYEQSKKDRKPALEKQAMTLYDQSFKVFGELQAKVDEKLQEIPKVLNTRDRKEALLIAKRKQLRADFLETELFAAAIREELADILPSIKLWSRQTIDVHGLQENLKKLPKDVTVILVMAQCYSGGFAHAIFNDTESDSGNFEQPVCGFFATVSSREAAGCTPDINEEAYDEFSSHFWAAMRGEDRLGNSIENADYDGNGVVSFDEAYAYTALVSRNIDIPMKTSGAFLRARSRFQDDERGRNDLLLKQHAPYSKTLELADPIEKKLLESLSERLGLEGESRYAAAENAARGIENKRAALKKQYDAKKRIFDGRADDLS